MKDPDEAALLACMETLQAIADNRAVLSRVDHETRTRLLTAAGQISRPDRNEQRYLSKAIRRDKYAAKKAANEEKLNATPIRRLRAQPVFVTPPPGLGAPHLPDDRAPALPGGDAPSASSGVHLDDDRICYVCKQPFRELHTFYDQLCPSCGKFNFDKRSQTADLSGRTALVTGARVKIGYQAAIMLLRSGARVIVATRFPRDAARRYAGEAGFDDWGSRLQIYGVDLRHTPSVEAFAAHLCQTEARLDFVVHNACQTVRRPTGFYAHLIESERSPLAALPEAAQATLLNHERLRHHDKRMLPGPSSGEASGEAIKDAPTLSQLKLAPEDFNAGAHLFPAGQLDADEQQVDLRKVNSWRLALDQVSTVELLEVQLVNSIAPFVLNARLRGLMKASGGQDKHIVNVSAMEGQFYRRFKTDKHPHTNMAKAALNMMTRTSAPDYLDDGIHMNSVDTGWVTDEDPAHIADRKRAENGFHPPLDIVDGAARIVDPILDGFNTGEHVWGLFLKDYRPTPW